MIWLLLFAAATAIEGEIAKRTDVRTPAAVFVDVLIHRHREQIG